MSCWRNKRAEKAPRPTVYVFCTATSRATANPRHLLVKSVREGIGQVESPFDLFGGLKIPLNMRNLGQHVMHSSKRRQCARWILREKIQIPRLVGDPDAALMLCRPPNRSGSSLAIVPIWRPPAPSLQEQDPHAFQSPLSLLL